MSDDPRVISQHTAWMLGAGGMAGVRSMLNHKQSGVDMVIFDWTNQIPCVLNCTSTPCDCSFRTDLDMVQRAAAAFVDHQVSRKHQGKPYLHYTFFIGVSDLDHARLQKHTSVSGPDHQPGNAQYPPGPCCENHLNGNMLRLAEQVKSLFLQRDPDRAALFYKADGRPLLFWWLGTEHQTCV